MEFEWDEEYAEFRRELRAFIEERRTPELLEEYAQTYGSGGPLIGAFHEELDQRGWMRMCWPVENGGEGRNLLYQYIFVEEMEYFGMPYGNLTYTSIAPSIVAFGSEDQKAAWLPGIYRGESCFAIGYSEPRRMIWSCFR